MQAVDGVSFEVKEGSALGLVGESGCGKSTTGRLITRLYEPTAGSMMFEGHDLATLSNRAMTPMRKEVQMIFQDPYSSLNPRHTVGTIVGTPLRVHKVVPEKQVLNRVRELLEVVGLNPEHYNRYPNEFSGGQRQRIGIARALALQPKLLVADEPVSALDVSIQAQVVNLLRDVQNEFNIAFLFIAHDLAVVRHFCPEIAVMYLGKIVEIGDRESVYEHPHHPYTQALLSASPDVKQAAIGGRRERIRLEGDVPSPINPPSGCRFRTRCWLAQDICAKQEPPLLQIGKTHKVACHFAAELGQNPAKPITAPLLGTDDQGNHDPGASPVDLPNEPGYRRHLVRPQEQDVRGALARGRPPITVTTNPCCCGPPAASGPCSPRRVGASARLLRRRDVCVRPHWAILRPTRLFVRGAAAVRRRDLLLTVHVEELFDASGLGAAPKPAGGALAGNTHASAPLAVRMRPRTLDELVGQEQLRAAGSPLRQLIEGDQPMSLLLWGPPGTGKTTIAAILSQQTDRHFVEVSAVSAGVKEVRAAIDAARAELVRSGRETVLFVDEVHRFSKAQQDALLPGVENRWVTLVAATTENPFFSVISPLLSRSLLLRLESLTDDDVRSVLRPGAGRRARAGRAASRSTTTRSTTWSGWPAATRGAR